MSEAPSTNRKRIPIPMSAILSALAHSSEVLKGWLIGKDLHCSQAIACLDMCRQRICRSGAQESSEARFTPLGNLPRSRVGWNGEASAIHSHQGLKMGMAAA